MDKDKEKNKKKDMDRGEKTPCCFDKQPPSIVSVNGNIAPLSERGEADREGGKERKKPPAALQHFTDGELLAEIQRRGYEAHKWLADDWHDEATGWRQ